MMNLDNKRRGLFGLPIPIPNPFNLTFPPLFPTPTDTDTNTPSPTLPGTESTKPQNPSSTQTSTTVSKATPTTSSEQPARSTTSGATTSTSTQLTSLSAFSRSSSVSSSSSTASHPFSPAALSLAPTTSPVPSASTSSYNSTTTADPGSLNSSPHTRNNLFQNGGAIAGLFAVVAIVIIAAVIAIVIFIRRRRTWQKFDDDLGEAIISKGRPATRQPLEDDGDFSEKFDPDLPLPHEGGGMDHGLARSVMPPLQDGSYFYPTADERTANGKATISRVGSYATHGRQPSGQEFRKVGRDDSRSYAENAQLSEAGHSESDHSQRSKWSWNVSQKWPAPPDLPNRFGQTSPDPSIQEYIDPLYPRRILKVANA